MVLKKHKDTPQLESSSANCEKLPENDLHFRSNLVNDNLLKEIYEQLPLGVTIEDYSEVKRTVNRLRIDGVHNLGKFLKENPEILFELLMSVQLLYTNASMLRMYRVESFQEFKDMDENFEHWKDSGWVEYYVKEITSLAEGGSYSGDVLDFASDNAPIEVRCISQVLTQHKDDWSCVITTHEDITDRKRAEALLLLSEARAKDFADSASDWFWEMDANLRFTYQSDNVEALTGESTDSSLGKTREEMLEVGYDRSAWEDHLATLESHSAFRDFEYLYNPNTENSHSFWIRTSGIPVFDDNGEFAGYRGSASDITSQKTAERNNAWLATILDNIGDAVEVTDASAKTLFVNSSHETVTGYLPEDVIGKTPAVLYRPAIYDPSLYEGMWDTVSSGGVWKGEVISRMKSGEERHQFLTVSAVHDSVGVLTNFIAVRRDITDLKNAEGALQTAKFEAETANQTKSVFLASMSHELRTPLNSIIGYSQLVTEGIFGSIGNDKYLEYVGHMQESGYHLLHLINDVLDISKIEAGQFTLDEDDVDLDHLLNYCLRMIRGRKEAEYLSIQLEPHGDLQNLRADERLVTQIVLNLLSNAVKFTPKNGKISLSAKVGENDTISIVISDTGVGIAAKDIPKVLEPFGQARSGAHITHEGTGLGLSLSKQLAELHDGTLELESKLGNGTTATVWFPSERTVRFKN